MKILSKIALALLATVLLATPALSAKKIMFNPGGSLMEFIEHFNEDREAESKYVIDGLCISACTMITGLIEDENVCTTKRGVLAFHSVSFLGPFGSEHSREGTRILGQILPEKVRSMLKVRGFDVEAGDEHPDLIYIKASELYKVCGQTTSTGD